MSTISPCSGVNGRLIEVQAQMALPLTLGLSYGEFDQGTLDVIQQSVQLQQIGVVTKVQVSQEIAAQFQNTLNDSIFITPFGDKPGQINLTFVANRKCNGTAQTTDVIQHYLDRRLQPGANLLPALVVIGSGTFRSYLVGMQLAADASGVQLVQGTLVFRGWPQ